MQWDLFFCKLDTIRQLATEQKQSGDFMIEKVIYGLAKVSWL